MDRSSAETIVNGFEDSGGSAKIHVRSEGEHWGSEAIRDYTNYSVVVSGDDGSGIGLFGEAEGVGEVLRVQDICMEVISGEGVEGLRFFSDGVNETEEYAEVTRWSDIGKGDLADLVWCSLRDISSVTPDIVWNIVDSYESIEELQGETKTGFSGMERVTWDKAVAIAESIPGNGYGGESE